MKFILAGFITCHRHNGYVERSFWFILSLQQSPSSIPGQPPMSAMAGGLQPQTGVTSSPQQVHLVTVNLYGNFPA